jgi:hypothetical protein
LFEFPELEINSYYFIEVKGYLASETPSSSLTKYTQLAAIVLSDQSIVISTIFGEVVNKLEIIEEGDRVADIISPTFDEHFFTILTEKQKMYVIAYTIIDS